MESQFAKYEALNYCVSTVMVNKFTDDFICSAKIIVLRSTVVVHVGFVSMQALT